MSKENKTSEKELKNEKELDLEQEKIRLLKAIKGLIFGFLIPILVLMGIFTFLYPLINYNIESAYTFILHILTFVVLITIIGMLTWTLIKIFKED